MLIAYIFLITLSGPASNIVENIGVLTASLSCGEVYFIIDVKSFEQLPHNSKFITFR